MEKIMLKKTLLSALVLGSFAASAFAENTAPSACPSVEAIKAVQLTPLDQAARCHGNNNSTAITATSNVLVDNTQWTFSLSGLKVKHKEDAAKKANKALKSLKGNPTPAFDQESNSWVCVYAVNHGLQAKAVTPAKTETPEAPVSAE
jgi:hypothetical protein